MFEEVAQQDKQNNSLQTTSFKDLFFKYIRFWPLFLVSVCLAYTVSFFYLRWSTKIFRSDGTFLVQLDKEGSGDKLEAVMMGGDRSKDVQTEMEILKSRPLMERVVSSLNSNFNYYVSGNIKELNVYKDSYFSIKPIKISDTLNSFTLNIVFLGDDTFQINNNTEKFHFDKTFTIREGTFKFFKNPKGYQAKQYIVTWKPKLNQAIEYISSLSITPRPNTGVINISMESTNPKLAADIVNQLMIEYGKVNIEDKNVTTLQKLQFVENRIKLMADELDSINDRFVSFKEKFKVIDPALQSDSYIKRIEESNEKLNEQRLQMANAAQIQEYLSRNLSDPVPSSLGIEDPTLNILIENYNKLQLERKQLLENAPPGNILVLQKAREVEIVRNKIIENIKNIRSSFSNIVGSLQNNSVSAISRMANIPAEQRQLGDIQRDLETKMLIYNSLLATKEQATIALASTISNSKILEEALPNPFPVKPDGKTTKLLSIVIGLLIPLAILIIIELLNDKITSRNDIEKGTSASILAEIGHSTASQPLVVTKSNRKVIAEQFRILRSNLQYVLRNIEKPVILVTSSFSGEGKSFVSTNVAAAISLTNKKTIVLEFDIRKPKVLSHLGLPKRQGLTNYLLGMVTVEDLPMQVPGYENLYVLPCGPLPPNPAELLLDPKLNDLFDYLKSYFDVIVMDTAPVGMVSDALTLSRFADCTLYIVREGHTLKKQIGLIDQHYTHGRLPKMSVVINDAKAHAGTGYYGYGNGTGSGYFEEEERSTSAMAKIFRWFGNKNGVAKNTKAKV